MKHLLASLLILGGLAFAAFTYLAVGSHGADNLAWDTVLIGVSAGLLAGGSVVLSKPFVGFIVGPVAAAILAAVMFGAPGAL